MSKLNWNNLNKEERAEYMQYQMAGSGIRSSMIPEDCSECPVCSTPSLSPGLCPACYSRYNILWNKLICEVA